MWVLGAFCCAVVCYKTNLVKAEKSLRVVAILAKIEILFIREKIYSAIMLFGLMMMVVMPTRIMWCLIDFIFIKRLKVLAKHSIANWEFSSENLYFVGEMFCRLGDDVLRQVIQFPSFGEISMTTFSTNQFQFIDISFFNSHNTRTTQWEDPRIQAAAAALSHGNLFSSSEHSSVETLFSSPTQLSSLGSSNGKLPN